MRQDKGTLMSPPLELDRRRLSYYRLEHDVQATRMDVEFKEARAGMGERCWKPLAVAILGMSTAVISYGVKEPHIGAVVYGCGLSSAGLALLHWFVTPVGRRA